MVKMPVGFFSKALSKIVFISVITHCASIYAQEFIVLKDNIRSLQDRSYNSAEVGEMKGQVSFLDFNSDGNKDLVFSGNCWPSPGCIELYQNTNGVFSNTHAFDSLENYHLQAGAWADINHDGSLDFVTYEERNNIRLAKFYTYNVTQKKILPLNISLPTGKWTNLSFSFCDIDNDSFPDLLVSGLVDSSLFWPPFTEVYHNENGKSFKSMNMGLLPMWNANMAWADFDKDGYSDLYITGNTGVKNFSAIYPTSMATRVYRNNIGKLNLYATLPSLVYGGAAWGDYDGDGKLDLVVSGTRMPGNTLPATLLYKNNGTGFDLQTNTPFDSLCFGSVSFADMDKDGDPDLLLTGEISESAPLTKIFRNDKSVFVDMQSNLPSLTHGVSSWGDFDGDGNMDIFLSGINANKESSAHLFHNIRGDFEPLNSFSSPIIASTLHWIDYDNDKKLDFFISDNSESKLYRNIGNGQFLAENTNLPIGSTQSDLGDFDNDGKVDIVMVGTNTATNDAVTILQNKGDGNFLDTKIKILGTTNPGLITIDGAKWGDYDNDGKLDLVVWGHDYKIGNNPFTKVFHNEGDWTFSELTKIFTGITRGQISWGDFNRDGRLDLALAGDSLESSYTPFVKIYRNENGVLNTTNDNISPLSHTSFAWGDFDNDGDLDFALSGEYRVGSAFDSTITRIFRNNGGVFEQFGQSLIGVFNGQILWIDADNDGDLDLIMNGGYLDSPYKNARILRNEGNRFTAIPPVFPNYSPTVMDVGDFDGDGKVDLLVSGSSWSVPSGTFIYKNTVLTANTLPSVPPNANATLGFSSVTLAWDNSTDNETSSSGLQYNVQVGKASGGFEILSSASHSDGILRANQMGNASHANFKNLIGLAPGKYFWKVQAIDNALGGSSFSPEGKFTIGITTPTLLETGAGNSQVTLKWKKLTDSNFQRYYLYYGLITNPSNKMDSVSLANDTVKVISELQNGQLYYFRVSAIDQGGNPSGYSNELTAIPDGTPPAIPSGLVAVGNDRTVTLSWKANTENDFLCYFIYQRASNGALFLIDSIANINQVSKTVTGLKNGSAYAFVMSAADKVLNHSGFSQEVLASPFYLVSSSLNNLNFGKTHISIYKDSVLMLNNSSSLPVTLDSIVISNSNFAITSPIKLIPASGQLILSIRFNCLQSMGGDFNSTLKIYFGNSTIEISLLAKAVANPYSTIEQANPSPAIWDTTSNIAFLASADDSDIAGTGDKIASYLWSSNLNGILPSTKNSFLIHPSGFKIGNHKISLRVVDNDGDTSAIVEKLLTIKGRKPFAKIDSITPKNLILRGSDKPHFSFTSYDLDELANSDHDSLVNFGIYSTLQGKISSNKDTTLDSISLQLGLHGFYARAIDNEGDTVFSDTQWIPVQTGVGLAVLVAGSPFGDYRYLFENISPNCNWAYAKLRERGFTDELIQYFNPVGWQSIGDSFSNSGIVDVTDMTVKNLRKAILDLKPKVENGVPLLISFLGHGTNNTQLGKFYLTPTEFITPDTLNAWLNTFTISKSMNSPIVILLDFCYAGTFLNKLKSSTQNRIVIASAAADRVAYFDGGRSFSYNIFKQISKGNNLAQAWNTANIWSANLGQNASISSNPQMNANSDNNYNDLLDINVLQNIYVGGSQQNQDLESEWKSIDGSYDNLKNLISFKVIPKNLSKIDKVWYSILTPDFDPANPLMQSLHSEDMAVQDSGFVGTYTLKPNQNGEFLITAYGSVGGKQILPISKSIYTLTTGIGNDSASKIFSLKQNFPNPFKNFTTIPFNLMHQGNVKLIIQNLKGERVKSLINTHVNQGTHFVTWNGLNENGFQMPAGLYIYTLIAPDGILRKKFNLQR